jgi:hypothetical protein
MNEATARTGMRKGGGWLAVACSLVVPGLGQWRQGRHAPAVAMFAAALLLWIVWLGWAVHLWSALDADLHAHPG